MAKIFEHQHRVTYAECTVGNHVYYANYLMILEEARGEFFRALGQTFLSLQERDVIFPVIECSINYRLPARYDDVLTVAIAVSELKGVRLGFSYNVINQHGKQVIEAVTRHVCTNIAEKPCRMPVELVGSLTPYLAETRSEA